MIKIFLFLARFYLNKINKSVKVRNLIMWPVASKILREKYNGVVKLKNNLLMEIDLKDILGRTILFYGPREEYLWEPTTTKLMEILIKNADESVIAGAHIGYTVLIARRAMVKKMARLHTFEPVKYLFDIAQKNIALNKNIGEIIINHAALNNESGKVKIALNTLSSYIIPANSGTGAKKIETAESITINDYMAKNGINEINFMLLDLEGNELNALKGMENTLTKSPPKDIIFESNRASKEDLDRYNAVSEFLKHLGYMLYFIEDDYKLPNFKNKSGEIKLYTLNNVDDFNKKHCNILATKRLSGELMKLDIKIS